MERKNSFQHFIVIVGALILFGLIMWAMFHITNKGNVREVEPQTTFIRPVATSTATTTN